MSCIQSVAVQYSRFTKTKINEASSREAGTSRSRVPRNIFFFIPKSLVIPYPPRDCGFGQADPLSLGPCRNQGRTADARRSPVPSPASPMNPFSHTSRCLCIDASRGFRLGWDRRMREHLVNVDRGRLPAVHSAVVRVSRRRRFTHSPGSAQLHRWKFNALVHVHGCCLTSGYH